MREQKQNKNAILKHKSSYVYDNIRAIVKIEKYGIMLSLLWSKA